MELAKKYILYARKSSESEDRQMASIDSQVQELRKLASELGLEVVDVLSESQSAKAPGRPIFNELLAKIRAGEADGILCWKLNRLARNPIDGGQISWMLQQGGLRHIQTFGRGYHSSDNVILMAVELGMANQFIRDLSTDTRRGLKAKAERGWYPTFASLGYMHNPYKHKGQKEIIEDPDRFDLVRKMFDLMLTGNYTPPQVLTIANEQWGLRTRHGNKVSRSNIYRLFADPFYYGEFEYPKGSGNWYKGNHKPMITRQEYDRIQFLLHNKHSTRAKTYQFTFRGPVHCGECGALITAEHKLKRQKNGVVRSYIYYHCTKRKGVPCSQPSIEEKELDKQITEIVERLEIPESFYKWAMEVLREQNVKESKTREQILTRQRAEFDDITSRLDRLIDLRAAGEITAEEFADRKRFLSSEKARLDALLGNTSARVDEWLEVADKYFSFAARAALEFKDGTPEVKRDTLRALGSNLLLKDRKLSVSLAKPLTLIEKVAPQAREINEMFEPLNTVEKQGQLSEMYAQNPDLLRG
jgi:site-specific DNA recombinase